MKLGARVLIPLFLFILIVLLIATIIMMIPEIRGGIIGAVNLIASGDPEVVDVTWRSIYISGTATALAILWSIPLGLVLGLMDFFGKKLLRSIFNALIGIPTVTLGLVLYLLISSTGPLGVFHLFVTPMGIIIGEAILITPIITSFTTTAIESVEPDIQDLAKTLGATNIEAAFAVLRESTPGVSLAVVGSFNRAIAELGVALMIGQNIAGETRVLTTAIAMEFTRGQISSSIALAIILLVIVLSISLVTNLVQRRLR